MFDSRYLPTLKTRVSLALVHSYFVFFPTLSKIMGVTNRFNFVLDVLMHATGRSITGAAYNLVTDRQICMLVTLLFQINCYGFLIYYNWKGQQYIGSKACRRLGCEYVSMESLYLWKQVLGTYSLQVPITTEYHKLMYDTHLTAHVGAQHSASQRMLEHACKRLVASGQLPLLLVMVPSGFENVSFSNFLENSCGLIYHLNQVSFY